MDRPNARTAWAAGLFALYGGAGAVWIVAVLLGPRSEGFGGQFKGLVVVIYLIGFLWLARIFQISRTGGDPEPSAPRPGRK